MYGCQGRFKFVGLGRLGIVGKKRFESFIFAAFPDNLSIDRIFL